MIKPSDKDSSGQAPSMGDALKMLGAGIGDAVKKLKPRYRLSALEQSEANAAAANAMIMAMVDLQVKTVYGLKYEGVAFVFQQQANTLSQKASAETISRREKAMLLSMSKNMLEVADHLKFQGAKDAGKND